MASLPRVSLPVDPPLRAIDAYDLALVGGDIQLFSECFEPYAESLTGQPSRLVLECANALYAYYIADTLAYLSRMLPPPRRSGLFSRSGRRSGGAEILAPDPKLLHDKPQEALVQWADQYSEIGGIMLLEARALLRQLSVAEVLRAQNIRLPSGALGDVRFSEELPDSEYLRALLINNTSRAFYWDERLLAEGEARLRAAFDECWIAYGVRYFRVGNPKQAPFVERAFAQEGGAVADAMLRMYMPIGVYRKRRLEALAIFQEMIAPFAAKQKA